MGKKLTAQERFNLELKRLLIGVQADAHDMGPFEIITCYVNTKLIENAVRALADLECSENEHK